MAKSSSQQPSTPLAYSVVVPLYNEAENILALDAELRAVMDHLENYEIIYINDGSKDRAWEVLKILRHAVIINLNRNYGQSTALDAGFKAAKGEIIISMDGDLQNDPRDIPRLLLKLKEGGFDVVAGWRKNRKDKGGIRALTKTGRFLRRVIIKDPVHDTGCTLRVYTKEAAKSLDLQGEMHRYILALLRWKGFRIGEIPVNHRARKYGETKYGYSKAVRGFIDLMYIWFINKYYQRPLHMFGYLSLASFLFGVLALGESVFARLIWHLSLNRNGWFFLGFFFLLMGILFFSFGIVIDLLIRIYLNASPHDKRYYVREVVTL